MEFVSIGFTMLRDAEEREVIVPNSTMMSGTVIRLGRSQLPLD